MATNNPIKTSSRICQIWLRIRSNAIVMRTFRIVEMGSSICVLVTGTGESGARLEPAGGSSELRSLRL
jgi:hypothetical protein